MPDISPERCPFRTVFFFSIYGIIADVMSILTISQLNYSIGVEDILEDINCIVNEGDRIGIVGVNGAGKSTLLKLIMGEYDPSYISSGEAYEKDSGTIGFSKDLSIAYLKQREHFSPGISVWDALDSKIDPEAFREKNGYSLEKGKRGILTSLGFSEESYGQEAVSLSGGEQTRLALGAVLLEEPELLLLDEPTNHLDIPTLQWLESRLRSYRGTLMIVSHDRYFLDKVVTKIFEIERGHLSVYNGNYTQYKERKQILFDEAMKHYTQQAEEIKHEEELIARWYGRGTEKLIKRAQSREKRLAHVERLERPQIEKDEIRLSFKQNLQTGNDVILINELGFAYDDAPDKALIKDFNAIIKKGDRVCITGPNGAGKTTLLRMIMGQLRPTEGRIKLGTNVVPAYYDQQQENLDPRNTVLEEMYNCKGILIGPDEYVSVESRYTQTDLRKMLGAMCFRGDDVFKKVGSLAGGEKARLSLLKLMMSGANVLVLDEPTNHLDISSKEVFEDALLAFPGTEIIVSHDRYLIDKVSTRIIEIGESEGSPDVSDACPEEKKETGFEGFIKGSEEERQAKKRAESKKRKNERLQREAENRVADLEDRRADLEEKLCDPEVFSDHEKARKLSEELERVKEELDDAYIEWLEIIGE